MQLFLDIWVFCVGLCMGSFANVLIDRLPAGKSVLVGRSQCDFCKKTLRWYELFPLFSFFIQGGKCRRCHKKLSITYPLLETFAGCIALFIAHRYVSVPLVIFPLSLVALAFFVHFFTDLKSQILPDSMTVLALIGVSLYQFFMQGLAGEAWLGLLISGLGACAFFYALWKFTKGRGMGFGDVKLAFVLGLFLGYPGIVMALYLAFLTGALVGVILIVVEQKSMRSKIAFGPFLIVGTVVSFLWQNELYALWRHWIGI